MWSPLDLDLSVQVKMNLFWTVSLVLYSDHYIHRFHRTHKFVNRVLTYIAEENFTVTRSQKYVCSVIKREYRICKLTEHGNFAPQGKYHSKSATFGIIIVTEHETMYVHMYYDTIRAYLDRTTFSSCFFSNRVDSLQVFPYPLLQNDP